MTIEYSLGLDLSGYSNNTSSLALAKKEGKKVEIIILKNLPQYRDVRKKSIESLVRLDEEHIIEQLKLAKKIHNWDVIDEKEKPKVKLAVDTPIDLQNITDFFIKPKPLRILELKKIQYRQALLRPIDNYYKSSVIPLGDTIGLVIMRFHWLYLYEEKLGYTLGENLYESYPKASLMELEKKLHNSTSNLYPMGYKTYDGKDIYISNTSRNSSNWKSFTKNFENSKLVSLNLISKCKLIQNFKELRIHSSSNKLFEFKSDVLDSILCALVLLSNLETDILKDISQYNGDSVAGERIANDDTLPIGYRIIKNIFWDEINIIDVF